MLLAPPADERGIDGKIAAELLKQFQATPAPSQLITDLRFSVRDLMQVPESLEEFLDGHLDGRIYVHATRRALERCRKLSKKAAAKAARKLYRQQTAEFRERLQKLQSAIDGSRRHLERIRDGINELDLDDAADLQALNIGANVLIEAIAPAHSYQKAIEDLTPPVELTAKQYRRQQIREAEEKLQRVEAEFDQHVSNLEALYWDLLALKRVAYGYASA
jgi:hypothetical protein